MSKTEPAHDDGAETAPTALVLMGVAGSGKTTIGQAVAERLGWEFLDADDLHPPENRAKMRAGTPLDEADRYPWLDAVASWIEQRLGGGRSVVVACSALRPNYRDRLARRGGDVQFVGLEVSPAELRARLLSRRGHFAGVDLLESQLDTLDLAGGPAVARLDASRPAEEVAARVIEMIGRA